MLQILSLRQVVRLIAGQFTGDPLQLLAIGQAVLDDHKKLLQLDRNLHQRDSTTMNVRCCLPAMSWRTSVCTTSGLFINRWKLWRSKQSRAIFTRQRRQRTQHRQRIAGANFLASFRGFIRKTQTVGNVPNGNLPVLFLGVLHDFTFGFIGFRDFEPKAQ